MANTYINAFVNLNLLPSLTSLYLQDAWYGPVFSGPLPSSLSASLKTLIIYGSNDYGANYGTVTGGIPESYGNLTQLSTFKIKWMKYMSGPLPDLSRTSLQTLSLQTILGLSGTLPALPSTLTSLTIAATAMNGTLPSSSCAVLNNLSTCALVTNNMVCPLPICLTNLACNPAGCTWSS